MPTPRVPDCGGSTTTTEGQMECGLDPLIGAMFTQMSKDAAFTTNSLIAGYERQIQVLSQALVDLYDVVMEDPNLTVAMQRRAMMAASVQVDAAERHLSQGYYADETFKGKGEAVR